MAGTDRRLWLWALGLSVAGLVVAATAALWSPPPAKSVTSPLETLPLGFGAPTYAAALSELDRSVRLGEERVARRPQDWLNQESLARALMARAQLTGSTDDLVRAGQALELGRVQGVEPSGPLLTSAAYKLTTHQIAAIAQDLSAFDRSAVPPLAGERAEAAALRGDIALYSNRYAEAERHYRAAVAIDYNASNAFRLAALRKYQGDYASANAGFARAAALAKRRTPMVMANAYLQTGSVALVRGDWDAAERWFARADRSFRGHWLIQAHRAQMAALRGHMTAAEQGYRASIAISRAPEVMDALAALYRSLGRIRESRALAREAKAGWTSRLRTLPAAYYAHAAEHELVLGSPVAALELARRNHVARPYGDAVTLLAAALIANGRPVEAVSLIEDLNLTKWRTAQQYVVLSQAYAILGRSDRSAAARGQAEQQNPRAFHGAAGLIWFGHH